MNAVLLISFLSLDRLPGLNFHPALSVTSFVLLGKSLNFSVCLGFLITAKIVIVPPYGVTEQIA